MNADHEDEKLDALLSDWLSESAPSARISELHNRIVTSLLQAHQADSPQMGANENGVQLVVRPSLDGPSARSKHWLSSLAVGTVAASLLAITLLVSGSNSQHVSPAAEVPPDYAWLHGEQLKNKEILLCEMESLFDHKVAWLAETDARMNFGFAAHESDSTSAAASDRLAVRILVQRRQPGTSTWQLALSIDVMSRSEELVHVVPQDDSGSELTLWTYRLPDGTIAVDSSVQIAGSFPFSAETSGLHQNDKPMQVATVHQKDADYRVFQTVSVLNGKVI
ncbi:MAG: hypothetical protein WBH50_22620 [Fuerstiella sp.]